MIERRLFIHLNSKEKSYHYRSVSEVQENIFTETKIIYIYRIFIYISVVIHYIPPPPWFSIGIFMETNIIGFHSLHRTV